MKKLSLILFLIPIMAVGQFNYKSTVVTDTIVWQLIEVINKGDDSTCFHQWVYSDTWAYGDHMSCLVDHHGFHCDWNDKERYAICKKCKRKIHEKEKWYQHEEHPPMSEYEILDADSVVTEIVPYGGIKIDTSSYWVEKTDTTSILTTYYLIDTLTFRVSDTIAFYSITRKEIPNYDTIPVIMLVSDTAYYMGFIACYRLPFIN